MQLTGKQILNAPPDRVWKMLIDPAALAQLVPGITSLERIDENSFISTLQVKMGPVNASFEGKVQLENIVEEQSFTLKLQQNSKIGNASAEINILLSPAEHENTELSFEGKVKLSGLLASMGQRVISGVAATLTRQFFSNIEKELSTITS